MIEEKGQVKGFVKCPECGLVLDLSLYHINVETYTEEVAHGQYKRPSCKCGCRFGYRLISETLEGNKTDEVTAAPQ